MWSIGPEVPAAILRYAPGLPIVWQFPTELDDMVNPVIEFAAQYDDTPISHEGTFARDVSGRWSLELDATATTVLADARRFVILDTNRPALAGMMQPRNRWDPDPTSEKVAVRILPGMEPVEVSPGIWRF